jgi:hypothetical protein
LGPTSFAWTIVGLGPGIDDHGHYDIPIQGRDEWLAAARRLA